MWWLFILEFAKNNNNNVAKISSFFFVSYSLAKCPYYHLAVAGVWLFVQFSVLDNHFTEFVHWFNKILLKFTSYAVCAGVRVTCECRDQLWFAVKLILFKKKHRNIKKSRDWRESNTIQNKTYNMWNRLFKGKSSKDGTSKKKKLGNFMRGSNSNSSTAKTCDSKGINIHDIYFWKSNCSLNTHIQLGQHESVLFGCKHNICVT